MLLTCCLLVTPAVAWAGDGADGDDGETAESGERMLSVDIHDARLIDVVTHISRYTGQNFVLLDSELENERVTVYAPEPVTLDEAAELLITVLRLKGLQVEDAGAYWKITRF